MRDAIVKKQKDLPKDRKPFDAKLKNLKDAYTKAQKDATKSDAAFKKEVANVKKLDDELKKKQDALDAARDPKTTDFRLFLMATAMSKVRVYEIDACLQGNLGIFSLVHGNGGDELKSKIGVAFAGSIAGPIAGISQNLYAGIGFRIRLGGDAEGESFKVTSGLVVHLMF